jgi:hypothetical protein
MAQELKAVPDFKLVGEDGNAFSIMGRFSRAARRAGWTKEDIDAVLDDAKSGDYDHLLTVFMPYEDYGDEDDDPDAYEED